MSDFINQIYQIYYGLQEIDIFTSIEDLEMVVDELRM